MTTSRIWLSRIIAFNWYGFRTIIPVNGLTLLCGETGTGKSALLDLIQFVMAGGAVKFNKAAAGESNARDLRGYCLCDTNTRQRDGQPRYLRRSGATVAALEFTWPAEAGAEPRRETWGLRIQFESPSAQPSYVRFFVPGRMERDDLCDAQGDLLSEELFRSRVKRELQGDAGFTSHKAFQEEMAVPRHLHFDDQQMRRTLPKAIAFELDSDYQRFIREFILEPSPPDVASTRRSLDALRQAEARVTQLHDQQQRLERIADEDARYAEAHREEAIFGHLRYALDHAEAQEKCDRAEGSLAALRSKHADNLAAMERAVAARDEAQRQVDAVKLIAGKEDPQLGDLERLTREQKEAAAEVERLTALSRSAREFLSIRAKAWEQWLRHAASLGEEATVDESKLRALRDADTSRALDGVSPLRGEFQSVWDAAKDRLQPALNEISELEKTRARLERQHDQLQSGRTAPTPLVDALRSTGTAADTLARVVEVAAAGEPWWGLLESLLGEHRNAVLVGSRKDFLRAREVWLKMPNAEPVIHPDEIPAITPQQGALSSFLETEHAVARRFLDWRFGDMIGVADAAALEDHSRAATPDGAIKEAPVRRRVTPEKEFTLGEKGLQRLRAAKERELDAVVARMTELTQRRDDVHAWLKRGKDARLDEDDSPRGSSEVRHLPDKRTELERIGNTLDLISTPELKSRLEQLHKWEKSLSAAHQGIGRLEGPITEFQIRESRQKDELESAQRELRDAGIAMHESRGGLPSGILDTELSARLSAATASPAAWKARRDLVDAARESWQRSANDARDRRLHERLELLEAHRDEFSEFDARDADNARYDKRLIEVREHEVQKFETLAQERRADWEKRLQEDVLNSLSDRLREAQETIRDFRSILSREIGGYRYVLSQTRDPLHRAMWKLMDQSRDGLQAGDALLDWKLQEEIAAAKQELMHALDHPEDKRAAALLDYRNYHRYDLDMVPTGHADDTEGRISLQESGRNLSGGEGQAPFFVAMLAAFHRVYDRGSRGQLANLGLVVMDEAFSKLSAGHIADCLALAEGFGLQLILAFPMDRLGTMIQHADSIIQCRVDKRRDAKGVPVEIINDVIHWDRQEAQSALLS